MSKDRKSPRKGRRSRFQTGSDAEEQLLDIEAAQRAVLAGKLKGRIDSVKKSRRRLANELDKVKGADDAYEEFS